MLGATIRIFAHGMKGNPVNSRREVCLIAISRTAAL
jgi:hypothetical protein